MAISRRGRARTETVLDLPDGLVTNADPTGNASEAYRALRNSLLYAPVSMSPKVVVVTSPGPNEGKSTVCANLGVVLAQVAKSTMVADLNLRKPAMHDIFELQNSAGIADVLAGRCDLEEVSQEPLPELTVATAGPAPLDPTKLLISERFAGFIKQTREAYDYVLLDAPPAEQFSDPAILAANADGVLLVINAENTRKESIRKSIRNLETVGARILGTVMNNAEVSEGGY